MTDERRAADSFRTPAIICARLLVIAAFGWVLLQVGYRLAGVLVPLAVAVLLAALIGPLTSWVAERVRLNRYVAAAVIVALSLAVVGGLLSAAIHILVDGMDELEGGVLAGLDSLQAWLAGGPLAPLGEDFSQALPALKSWVDDNSQALAGQAVQATASLTSFLASTLLALVSLFFFVADGRTIAAWFVARLPRGVQDRVWAASERGWTALKAYSLTQLVVAGVDALGIALGALLLGVPFVLPIGVLVFLTAFIPVVGALLSGAVAVLIALATGGPLTAVLMLAVVVLVQQAESNLLAPLLLGGAVRIHPWGIIIGVAAGTFLFGLLGALLAVPIMAVVKAALLSGAAEAAPPPVPADERDEMSS